MFEVSSRGTIQDYPNVSKFQTYCKLDQPEDIDRTYFLTAHFPPTFHYKIPRRVKVMKEERKPAAITATAATDKTSTNNFHRPIKPPTKITLDHSTLYRPSAQAPDRKNVVWAEFKYPNKSKKSTSSLTSLTTSNRRKFVSIITGNDLLMSQVRRPTSARVTVVVDGKLVSGVVDCSDNTYEKEPKSSQNSSQTGLNDSEYLDSQASLPPQSVSSRFAAVAPRRPPNAFLIRKRPPIFSPLMLNDSPPSLSTPIPVDSPYSSYCIKPTLKNAVHEITTEAAVKAAQMAIEESVKYQLLDKELEKKELAKSANKKSKEKVAESTVESATSQPPTTTTPKGSRRGANPAVERQLPVQLSDEALAEQNYTLPVITHVPLLDGPLKVVCVAPGNLLSVNLNNFVKPLELEASKKTKLLTHTYQRCLLCAVCGGTTGNDVCEKLRACDLCGLTVHLDCCHDQGTTFGHNHLFWKCSVCIDQPPKIASAQQPQPTGKGKTKSSLSTVKRSTHSCGMCPHSGGAMSKVDGEWVHEICKTFCMDVKRKGVSPDADFCAICGEQEGVGGDGVEEMLVRRTIKCADENCMVTFHPMCALLVANKSISPVLKKESTTAQIQASKRRTEQRRDTRAKSDKRRAVQQTDEDLDEEELMLEKCGLGIDAATYGKRKRDDLKPSIQFSVFFASQKDGMVAPVGFCPCHNPNRDSAFRSFPSSNYYSGVSRCPPPRTDLPNRTAAVSSETETFHAENRDSDDELEEVIERDAEKREADAKAMARAIAAQKKRDAEAAKLEAQKEEARQEERQRKEKRKRDPPKERKPPPKRPQRPRVIDTRFFCGGKEITDPELLRCRGKGNKTERGGSRAAAIHKGLEMDGWTLYYCTSSKRYYIWGPDMQFFKSVSDAYLCYNSIVNKIRRKAEAAAAVAPKPKEAELEGKGTGEVEEGNEKENGEPEPKKPKVEDEGNC